MSGCGGVPDVRPQVRFFYAYGVDPVHLFLACSRSWVVMCRKILVRVQGWGVTCPRLMRDKVDGGMPTAFASCRSLV